MKKKIYASLLALIVVVLIFSTGGCRRWSHNGEIDGSWKVEEIYDADSDSSLPVPDMCMIAIGNELFQLRVEGGASGLTGIISYDESAATLGISFPVTTYQGSESYINNMLAKIGVYDNPVLFKVEKADSKWLILKAGSTTITSRRF